MFHLDRLRRQNTAGASAAACGRLSITFKSNIGRLSLSMHLMNRLKSDAKQTLDRVKYHAEISQCKGLCFARRPCAL